MFSYLKCHPNFKLVVNPELVYLWQRFKGRFKDDTEWFDFYGDVKEDTPVDAPVPYGKEAEINYWLDADHAGNFLTRRSHT